MPSIDLHIHTNASDGVCSPEQILDRVRQKNLRAFAIADHDTLAGFRQVRSLLRVGDPELIIGVELSVSADEYDMHLLAYLFDGDHAIFNDTMEGFREFRNRRGAEIVQRLNALGVDISLADVERTAAGAAIGRPHIAETMYRTGAVRTYEQAFREFVGIGGPAYVPKKNFTPVQAIAMIHLAGGVAVLAHPGIDETSRHLEMLVGLGLDGIEVYHPAHKQHEIDNFKHLAERYRMVITGGSDFHGREGRYGDIGSQRVPDTCLEALRLRAAQRKVKA